jgi:hypothetical protein
VSKALPGSLVQRPHRAGGHVLGELAARDLGHVREPDDPPARRLPQPHPLDRVEVELDVERPPQRAAQVLGRPPHGRELDEEHRHLGRGQHRHGGKRAASLRTGRRRAW